MAFRSAQQARVHVGHFAAAAYTRSASTDSSTEQHDVTTLADTAKVFIPGHESSAFALAGPLDLDASADAQYDAITDLKGATSPTPITYMPLGTDGAVWLVEADQTEFSTTTSVGGTADWTMSAQTTGQTDFDGVVLENETTVTVDTDGTAHTGPVGGTTDGAVAHLHVSAFSGFTSDDIIIEGSTNGLFAGEETTVVTFTQVTGIGSERVAVTGTVPRYLRVVDDVLGTGSITHTVAVSRR